MRLQKRHVAAAVALAIGGPGLVHAQDADADADEPIALEEVQVTGTRIQRSGMTAPTPVTAVSVETLSQMAPGSVVESLSQLPQFFGNIQPESIVGGQNSGGANLNLRGAGVNRTLVLLDGRRVVSSNRFGTVDVNMLPESLLRGIETVTGGASASYGTDAVAGVVNFLLDTDFEGVKTHLQGGQTTRNDGENWEAGIAFGRAFGDRFHLVGSYMLANQDAINTFESLESRPYFNQASRVTNPDPVNGPREIIYPYVTPTNFTNGGVIVEPPLAATAPDAGLINPILAQLNRLEFLPDGSIRRMDYAGQPGTGGANTGCQCFAQDVQTYGVDADTEISSGYRRENAFLHGTFDLGDTTQVFLQGLYGTTRNSDRRESISLLSTWQGRIYGDNVYLPGQVRSIVQQLPANRQFFGFGFFGLDQPGTPLGDSRQITDNKMIMGTIGFSSAFGESSWKLDGYYQYGENRQDFITVNGIRVDRLPLALDAVSDANGEPVCRVSLPQFDPTGIFRDCVPVNLFGGVQNISSQAAAWIVDDGKVARQWTDQHAAELVLNGELWEGFGAGSLATAVGLSYRKDSLEQRTLDPSDEFPALPDGTLLSSLGIHPATLRGVVPQGQSGGVPGYTGIPGLRFVPAGYLGDANSSSVLFSSLREIAGDYDVKEAFAEFNLPLVRDASWARSLELSTAVRWADYAGSGEIWAWKVGASWQITDDVRLRATQSRDVRAATLQERFDQTRGGVNVQDPANGNITVTTASLSGGNANVEPEQADTLTAGIVYQPSWLQGFSTSVDWYRIDIDDAIAQLTAQNIVSGCFNGDTVLCQYVFRRDNLPNGTIDRVETLFINLANQLISGVDVELAYGRSVQLFSEGGERVTWRFFGTFLDENSIQNRGGARDERAGQVGPGLPGDLALPEYKLTSNIAYRNGPMDFFVQGRWIDGGSLDRLRIETQQNIANSIDDNGVGSVFYLDANVSFFNGDEDNLQIYFNVQNLLDRYPPLAPGVIGRAGTTAFNATVHDVVGRRFTLGVNYQF